MAKWFLAILEFSCMNREEKSHLLRVNMPGWRSEPVFVSSPLASDQNAGLILSLFQGTSDIRFCILNEGRLLAM